MFLKHWRSFIQVLSQYQTPSCIDQNIGHYSLESNYVNSLHRSFCMSSNLAFFNNQEKKKKKEIVTLKWELHIASIIYLIELILWRYKTCSNLKNIQYQMKYTNYMCKYCIYQEYTKIYMMWKATKYTLLCYLKLIKECINFHLISKSLTDWVWMKK